MTLEKEAEERYGTEIESHRGGNPFDQQADRKTGFIDGYNACANSNYAKQQAIKGKIEVLEVLIKENSSNVDLFSACLFKIRELRIELKQLETPKL